MADEFEGRITKWVKHIQGHWPRYREKAAKGYGKLGRGAILIDLHDDLIETEARDEFSYLTVAEAAKVLQGMSLVTFEMRVRQYNPERQILFYFCDYDSGKAAPREMSEYSNGTPNIDVDANWHNKNRVCPECKTQFKSVRDRGQCPECGCIFLASDSASNSEVVSSAGLVPPIVEVEIDTTKAEDCDSLVDMVYEKEMIRGEVSLETRERTIIDVTTLKGEVDNGGFGQFFTNTSGSRVQPTIAALKAIGAVQTQRILEQACSVFPNAMPSCDGTERFDQIDHLPPNHSTLWDRLDSEFYNCEEDLEELLWAYWKNSNS